MEAVGYDMYVKLLNEAVSLMKGETPARPVDQDCLVDMQVQAHIPESYIDSYSEIARWMYTGASPKWKPKRTLWTFWTS